MFRLICLFSTSMFVCHFNRPLTISFDTSGLYRASNIIYYPSRQFPRGSKCKMWFTSTGVLAASFNSHCLSLQAHWMSTNWGLYWTSLKCKEHLIIEFIGKTKHYKGFLQTWDIISSWGSGSNISCLLSFEPIHSPHLSSVSLGLRRLSGFDECSQDLCPFSAIHQFLCMWNIQDKQLFQGSLYNSDRLQIHSLTQFLKHSDWIYRTRLVLLVD